MTRKNEIDAVVEGISNALSQLADDARFRCEDEWLCADDIRYLLRYAEEMRAKVGKVRKAGQLAFEASQHDNGKLLRRAIRAERKLEDAAARAPQGRTE